jgi:hypothetical protein
MEFIRHISEIYDLPKIESYELVNERNGPRRFYRKINDENYSQKYKVKIGEEYFCVIVHTSSKSTISNKSTAHRVSARTLVYDNAENLFNGYKLKWPEVLKVKNQIINENIKSEPGKYHFYYKDKAVEVCDWICDLESYTGSDNAFISTIEFSKSVSDAFDSLNVDINIRIANKLKEAILYNYTHNNVNFEKFFNNCNVTKNIDIDKLKFYQELLDSSYKKIKDNKNVLIDLPLVITHADLYTGNIGYKNDTATYLYDFEDLRYGLRFEDVLRIFCDLCVNNFKGKSEKIYREKFKIFTDVYNIKDRFSTNVKKLLPTLIIIKILYEIHFASDLLSTGDVINYYDECVKYLDEWVERGEFLFQNIDFIDYIINE